MYNCERIIVLLESLFLGILTMYTGLILGNPTKGWNMPSVILISIGLTFMLFGIIFTSNTANTQTNLRNRNHRDYTQVELVV